MQPLELNYEKTNQQNQRLYTEIQEQKQRSLYLQMTNYDFEFTTLDERIAELESRVRELEYIIDKTRTPEYNFDNYSLGEK